MMSFILSSRAKKIVRESGRSPQSRDLLLACGVCGAREQQVPPLRSLALAPVGMTGFGRGRLKARHDELHSVIPSEEDRARKRTISAVEGPAVGMRRMWCPRTAGPSTALAGARSGRDDR